MAKKKNDNIGKIVLVGGLGLLIFAFMKNAGAKQEETGSAGTPYANEDIAGLLKAIQETPPQVSFPSSTYIFDLQDPALPSRSGTGSGTGSLTGSKKEYELINEALSYNSSPYYPEMQPYKTTPKWFSLFSKDQLSVNTNWKDTNSSRLDNPNTNTVKNVFGDLGYQVDLSGIKNSTTTKKESNISTTKTATTPIITIGKETNATPSKYVKLNTGNNKLIFLDSNKMVNLQDTRNYSYDGSNITVNAGEVTSCQAGGKCSL